MTKSPKWEAVAQTMNARAEAIEQSQGPPLSELETRIERGLQTFIDVGLALLEIRDRRLYREAGFKSFDTYCRERWGWSRDRGYQLMQAAEVVQSMPTKGRHSENRIPGAGACSRPTRRGARGSGRGLVRRQGTAW
jgi:hypothetical protein